jgi:hypothetical protein
LGSSRIDSVAESLKHSIVNYSTLLKFVKCAIHLLAFAGSFLAQAL